MSTATIPMSTSKDLHVVSISSIPKPEPLSLLTRATGIVYGLSQLIFCDSLFWERRFGAKNVQADVCGPYWMPGAPWREVAPGKAIVASLDNLKACPAIFLFYGTVKDAKGNPIQAEFDGWQADWNGDYYFAMNELRGKFHTDSEGRFQVVSVPPGAYGGRPGHFHFHITPTGPDADKASRGITTQLYLTQANSPKPFEKDFTRFIRTPRLGNLMNAWASESEPGADEKTFFDLPKIVRGSDPERDAMIWEWNAVLKEAGNLTIGAGARYDFIL